MPNLVSPCNNTIVTVSRPNLIWYNSAGALSYRVRIADNAGLNNPVQDEYVERSMTSTTTYAATPLADGNYYWGVQAQNRGVLTDFATDRFIIDIPRAEIQIQKSVDRPVVPANTTVTISTTVNNTGDFALHDVTISDSACVFDKIETLEPGKTHTDSCMVTVQGDYRNSASAIGTSSEGVVSDSTEIFVYVPDGKVGHGTHATCNEGALHTELIRETDDDPVTVTFNCGTDPHTITIGTTKTITKDTAIDGGDLITISGNNSVRVFDVKSGATLHIKDLNVADGLVHRSDGSSDYEVGGGIRNFGTLIIENSELVNNEADAGGGLHNAWNGTAIISHTKVLSNYATFDGGGIYNVGYGRLTITNSTVISNNIAGKSGGGLFNWWTGKVEIISSTLTSNRAGHGGAIANDQNGAVTLNNSQVLANIATWTGGGIVNWYTGTVTITNQSIISGNKALSTDKNYPGVGGGIHNSGYGRVIIDNSTLSNNTARMYGGAIQNDWKGVVSITHNAAISGNLAVVDGGGVYNAGQGRIKITSTHLFNNSAGSSGGGILNWATGTVEVSNSELTDNRAGHGGAVAVGDTAVMTITNSTISGNSAQYLGGGVVNWGDWAQVVISDSSLIGNTAMHGGSITNYEGEGKLTINNSELTSNSATEDGGGIYNRSSGTVTIADTTFSNNRATYKGGGIYNTGNPTLFDVSFSGNTAMDGQGGGMDNSGSPTLTRVTFTSNGAPVGGGMYNTGNPTLTDSIFDGNWAVPPSSRAAGTGGGMYNASGHATLTNVTFSDNYARGDGAGLVNLSGSATLTNVTFSANQATPAPASYEAPKGGGLCNWDGSLVLSNVTFSGNVIYGDGGGLYNRSGSAALTNVTISENEVRPSPRHQDPQGGGVHNWSGSVGISQTIIAGNFGGDCWGTIDSQGYNLDSDDTCQLTATGDITNTAPRLGPLQDNGGSTWTHALLPSSPAIDAGDPENCPPPGTDQRGEPRPADGDGNGTAICDIGAYELHPESETAEEGEVVTVSTAPAVAGEAGASATLTNNTAGSGPATVTVATYFSNPVPSPIIDVGGGFVDLRVTGADPSDVVAASFYYPSSITDDTEADLILLYYTGSQWVPVRSSGDTAPDKNTTDNLDSTVSGGRFSVTFDNTSEPLITDLSGTVFAATINTAPTAEIGADATLNEEDSFSRTGSFSDPDSVSWTATVDYGDGSGLQPLALNADRTFNLSHVYADDGTFTVGVCITDDGGAIGCASFQVVVLNVPPTVDAGPDQTVDEGTVVSLAPATFTDPGTLDTHTATIDWGDGSPVEAGAVSEGDGSGTVSGSHIYADDGVYSVIVTACDDDDGCDEDSLTVTVNNVAPTVSATGDAVDEEDTAAVSASFTDPGWLDTHEALIDWNDGTPAETVTVIQGSGSGTLAASHVYGDNGIYAVVITVTDDDSGVGTATAVVEVANLAPSVSLDYSSATLFAGGDAFLGHRGIEQTHYASASDPGSDDLTFAWSSGATNIYYNDGVGPDPFPSPGGVFPFSASDSAGVTFTGPGVHAITVDVADDDSGADSASLPKLVTDDGDCTRSQGFWKHQLSEKGKHQVDDATLEAYLDIVNFASAVFSEQVPASAIEEARDVMWARGPSMRNKAAAQLLAAWLNFAHGAVGWDELIDTNDDDVGDTPFHQVMSEAETILLDADATHEELAHAKDLAEAANLHAP